MLNEIIPIEKNSQRVLMTSQLAEAYGTNSKIISYNFNNNKDRYVINKHYYLLEGEEMRTFREFHELPKNIGKIYLWTERGALLHAKSLNTETAWEVYNLLVDNYFRRKAATASDIQEVFSYMTMLCNAAMEQIDSLTEQLAYEKYTSTIDVDKQRQLRAMAKDIVDEILCEGSVSHYFFSATLINRIWLDYRRHFHLDSYKNTLVSRFDEAIDYLENYQPPDWIFEESANLDSVYRKCDNEAISMEDFIYALRSNS